MFTTFPSVWLLLGLPFVSSALIADVPWLRRASHRWTMWLIGVAALLVLFAGLVGLLSPAHALPLMILAGAVSGFALLWPGAGGGTGDSDDWRWRRPPPDEPPRGPDPDGWIDWDLFDRERARWERPSIRGR